MNRPPTHMMIVRRLPSAIALALFLFFTAGLQAQWTYDFEQDATSWRLRDSDCDISETGWAQRRTTLEKHGGLRAEHFHFEAGNGTKVLVSQAIDPCALIPELAPEMWIKANRAGARLLARVVFPQSRGPDGGPVRVMIEGSKYKLVDQWERLHFTENGKSLHALVTDQLWHLRNTFGPELDLQAAYVDLIALNLYSGPGTSDVWIDDLLVQGAVRSSNMSDSPATNPIQLVSQEQDLTAKTSRVRFDGNIIELDGQPFFAKIIQHNGESFESLKRIGFNTIELRAPPTPDQLQSAQQLDVWLICPPPSDAGLSPIGNQYDRVLAWSVGRNLSGRDLDNVHQLAREIRQSDSAHARPLVAEVRSNWSDYGEIVEIVATHVDAIGGGFPLSAYSNWLAERQQLVGKTVPLWAGIPTELPQEILAQVAAMADSVPPTPLEAQQLEFALYEALAGGARGLRFLSRNRLDATDPVTTLRVQTLKWLLIRTAQCEPWGAGGAVAGELGLNQEHLTVTALQTERARLLLIQRPTQFEQWSTGDIPIEKVEFIDDGASAMDRAYWLAPSGMIPLPMTNVHGGSQIEITRCPPLTSLVITDSPVVVNRLADSYRAPDGQTFAQVRLVIVRNWLAIAQLIDREMARMQKSGSIPGGAINEALTAVQKAEAMISDSNSITADEYVDLAEQRLALARKHFLSEARMPFRSAAASPLLAHPSLVTSHWKLAGRLQQANWMPNALAGGDFENLQHMVDNGWLNRRTEDESITTKVELTPTAAIGGGFGLSMSASRQQPSTDAVESAPLWITTGDIPVKAGQTVRIHGWARLPAPIQGSSEGLTIIDSLGGPQLAERIIQSGAWQEFSLYRGVSADGKLNITFALTGLGTVLIDEVTVRIADTTMPVSQSPQLQQSALTPELPR